ncbi:MAG: flippase [Ruminococcus flavefaciens]
MNAILTMSSFIFPLITFPYVSRILLPEGTGKVNFATSFISYFTMFAQLGIPTYGIRICAMVRDDRKKLTRTVHELLFINLVMCVISYLAFFIILFTVPKLHEDKLLYVIVSANILLTTIGMDWLYKALEQYTYITIRSLIFKVVALVAMFLLVHEQKDYVIYGGIAIFAGCASNIMNLINVHKYIDLKPVGDYQIKRHLKAVGVFFAMSCATTIYLHLDTIMLKFMTTDADVGYYGAATKIKTILVSIVTSLGTVLLPRVSYYIKQNQMDSFRSVTKKALNFVFLISLPLTVYFILFAKEGIYFLSGKEYTGAIVPMQIIMQTLILIGITNILGIQILVPLGKEKYVLYSEIAGAITDLILNAILIPFFQSSGAAIGTVAAEFAVLLVQFYALKDEVTPMFKAIKYYKIIIALVLGVAASFWVPFLNFNSFVTLVISAVIFFAVYGVALLIMKEQLVNDIFNQVKSKLHI